MRRLAGTDTGRRTFAGGGGGRAPRLGAQQHDGHARRQWPGARRLSPPFDGPEQLRSYIDVPRLRAAALAALSAGEDTSWARLLELKLPGHHILSALGVRTTRRLHCAQGTPALRAFAREPSAEAAATFATGDYVVKRDNGNHGIQVFVMHAGHDSFSGRRTNLMGIADSFDRMLERERITRMMRHGNTLRLCRAPSGKVQVRPLGDNDARFTDRSNTFFIEQAVQAERPRARHAPTQPTTRRGGATETAAQPQAAPSAVAPLELKLFTFGSDVVLVKVMSMQHADGSFVNLRRPGVEFPDCLPCELTDLGCTHSTLGVADSLARGRPTGAGMSAARPRLAEPPHSSRGGGWEWECYQVDEELRYIWPNDTDTAATRAIGSGAVRPPPLALPSHVSKAGVRAALELASTLGAAFGVFGRIDMYIADGGPVVGEVTLTPGVLPDKIPYSQRWHAYHRGRLARLLGAQWRGIAGGGRAVRTPCWLRDSNRFRACHPALGPLMPNGTQQPGALELLLDNFCGQEAKEEKEQWRALARDIADVYARYKSRRLALEPLPE